MATLHSIRITGTCDRVYSVIAVYLVRHNACISRRIRDSTALGPIGPRPVPYLSSVSPLNSRCKDILGKGEGVGGAVRHNFKAAQCSGDAEFYGHIRGVMVHDMIQGSFICTIQPNHGIYV